MQVESSIEAFTTYVAKRHTHGTAAKYAQSATRFLAFCQRNNLELRTLPPGILRIFADYLLHEGMKNSTVKSTVSGVSKYLEWCRANGIVMPVFASPDLPKQHRPPPNVLSSKALLAYIAISSRLHEPVRTALILLPFCGLRSFELAQLRLSDIKMIRLPPTNSRPQMELVAFQIQGKGGKFRISPLLEDGKPLLIAYLQKYRRVLHFDSPYLFPMLKGRPISSRTIRLHVQQIREAIARRIGTEADKIHPHALRRTYLTALWKQGIDPLTIAKIAGHASVQTSYDHYLAIEADDIAGATAHVRLVEKGLNADRRAAAGARLSAFLENTAQSRGVLPIPDMPPTPPPETE